MAFRRMPEPPTFSRLTLWRVRPTLLRAREKVNFQETVVGDGVQKSAPIFLAVKCNNESRGVFLQRAGVR